MENPYKNKRLEDLERDEFNEAWENEYCARGGKHHCYSPTQEHDPHSRVGGQCEERAEGVFWHASKPVAFCPHCGQKSPAAEEEDRKQKEEANKPQQPITCWKWECTEHRPTWFCGLCGQSMCIEHMCSCAHE